MLLGVRQRLSLFLVWNRTTDLLRQMLQPLRPVKVVLTPLHLRVLFRASVLALGFALALEKASPSLPPFPESPVGGWLLRWCVSCVLWCSCLDAVVRKHRVRSRGARPSRASRRVLLPVDKNVFFESPCGGTLTFHETTASRPLRRNQRDGHCSGVLVCWPAPRGPESLPARTSASSTRQSWRRLHR